MPTGSAGKQPPLHTGGRGDCSPHRIAHPSQREYGESEDFLVQLAVKDNAILSQNGEFV